MDDRAGARPGTEDLLPAPVVLTTEELGEGRRAQLRPLFDLAFADFTDEDYEHGLGGLHVVVEQDGQLIAHAAVVPRELHLPEQVLDCGYVENVATHPRVRGQGLGAVVVRELNRLIVRDHQLGALRTGVNAFYRRYGWLDWRGQTFEVDREGGWQPTDDHGQVMVLPTPGHRLDPEQPIAAPQRPGKAW